MKKLNTKQLISISMMLFAIFFGAGNMIFPPAMGYLAGSNFPSALVGFILTDVGIAVLGIAAIVMVGTTIDDLGKLIGHRFALFFSVSIYLLIGPLFALPRTATVSYEISLAPYTDPSMLFIFRFVFSAVYFLITYYLSSNSGKLVDIVGNMLTPFLLLSIAVIFIAALVNTHGNGSMAFGEMMAPSGDYQTIPLFKGMIEGYNALDGPAGLAFAIIVIDAIKGYGVTDKKNIAKYTILCGLGSAVFLSVVYFMLSYVGAITNQPFPNGGALLHSVTNHLLGNAGGLVLGVAVLLACLATSIGLTASFARYFTSILPEKWTYKRIAAVVCASSFVIANVGLNQLIKFSLPVLIMIYPVTITMIVLSLLKNKIKDRHMVYIMGIIFTFVISFINGLQNAGLNLGVIDTLVNKLPLNNIGFGWIVFAAIGALIGALPFWPLNKKRTLNSVLFYIHTLFIILLRSD